MTADELKKLMQVTQIGLNELAAIANVQQRTARYWVDAHSPVPRPIAIIMLALSKGALAFDFVVDYVEAEERSKL